MPVRGQDRAAVLLGEDEAFDTVTGGFAAAAGRPFETSLADDLKTLGLVGAVHSALGTT